jgi:hypothetical protein
MNRSKSRGRAAQAVGALLALTLLAVLGLLLRSEGEAADNASAPKPTESAEPVKTSVLAPGAASDAKESSRVEPELASPPSTTPPDERIRVRVLHHETLEPLAGAEVRWIEGAELRDPELSPFVFDPTSESRWVEGCQLVTCDAAGEARLPKPESSLRVEATYGALWGHTWVTLPTKDAYDVFVAPSETLRVLVVDSEGRPAPGVGCGGGSSRRAVSRLVPLPANRNRWNRADRQRPGLGVGWWPRPVVDSGLRREPRSDPDDRGLACRSRPDREARVATHLCRERSARRDIRRGLAGPGLRSH